MVKVCLITDQHIDCRNSSLILSEHQEKFYSNLFFPYLLANDIKQVINLGDLIDRRKYVNFNILYRARDFLFKKYEEYGITVHNIIGNHDIAMRNTNDINSPEMLLGQFKNQIIYKDPTEIEIGGIKLAILPWVCSGNYEQSMKFLSETRSDLLFAHLEISGFEMYRGAVSEHGFDSDLFNRFDMVFSGHFHHKSSNKNIHYLGAPYEMTWSDYNDPRGFHIFDTETRELTFIENPYTLFSKVHYDDTDKSLEDLINIDPDQYSGRYVKVIVHNKSNPYWFDIFIDELSKTGVYDLQIVDDHMNLDVEDEEHILSEIDDTETLLKKYVEQVAGENSNLDQKQLIKVLLELLHQAQDNLE